MDTKKQCAIFIDIDGTLMESSSDALNENLNTINQLRQLGHKVFINTGRATSYIPKKIDILKNFDGLIAGSGAYVRIGNDELLKKLMPYEAVQNVCRYFIENDIPGVLEGEHSMYYFKDVFFKESYWINLNSEILQKHITKDTPIMKFTVEGIAPKGFADTLGDEYFVLQHKGYAEVGIKGYTKALGIKTVIAKLGIEKEQTIAIGDSMNDFEMIEYAGLGIAMGNAIDEIKNAADIVTDTANNAGVSKALKEIFSI